MRFPKAAALAVALVVLLLLAVAGCRRAAMLREDAKRQAQARRERQMFEIRRGGNIAAQSVETVELLADIHLAGEDAPRRAVMRIRPGTWLVPEQRYDADQARADAAAEETK